MQLKKPVLFRCFELKRVVPVFKMFVGEDSCPNCLGCSCELAEPFIKCAECQPEPVYICLHCFAKGFENDSHLSNHSYEIMRRDFPILENSWTAAEEESLVTAVADCGLGNWADISTQISSKSKEECERHYFSCYVNNPVPPLPEFPEQEFKANPQPIVYKLSDDPPRPVEGSNMCIEMAGYLAARSEFSVEYDNFVELDLRHITLDEDEDKFDVDLKVAVLQTYHSCLRERQRRKRIIRKYGLINLHKACSTERRSERNLKPYLDTLCTVMRLMPPQEYDKYLEALNYEQDLKRDIHHLQEFHENGLTHLRHIKIYTLLKSRREIAQSKRHMLDDVLSNLQDETACQSWLQRQAALGNMSKGFSGPLPSVPRRLAPPLEIVGLPGYDKLSSEERELCASTRLAPEAYLEFKNILITECKKVGTLKLAHARSLIKIDVNKTRRIYDFLLEQGFIKKDN